MNEQGRSPERKPLGRERAAMLALVLAAAATEAGCATAAWSGGYENRIRVAGDILKTEEGEKDIERDPFLKGMIENRGGMVGTFNVSKDGTRRTVRSYYTEMRTVKNADNIDVEKPIVVFADGTDTTNASGDVAVQNAAANLIAAAKKEIPGFKSDANTRSEIAISYNNLNVSPNESGMEYAVVSAYNVSVFVEAGEQNDITKVLSPERLAFYALLFSGLGIGPDSKSTGAMPGSRITITDHIVSGWDVKVDIFLGGVETRISEKFSVDSEDPALMDAKILKIVEKYKYKKLSEKEKKASGASAGTSDTYRGPVDMNQWSETWIRKLGWQSEIDAIAKAMHDIPGYKYGKISTFEVGENGLKIKVEFVARTGRRARAEVTLEMQPNAMDDTASKWVKLRNKYEENEDQKAGQELYVEGARRRRIDLEAMKAELVRLIDEAAEEATQTDVKDITPPASSGKAKDESASAPP